MTTTYDPLHAQYLDEADVRNEISRVADICHACHRCVDLCGTFPTLFEMIGRQPDHDAGRMTPAQQNQVIGECFQCKVCAIGCPYLPAVDERAVDFPRLMLRAKAMLHDTDQVPLRERTTTQLLARIDLVGPAASRTASVTNRVVAAEPGSVVRKVMEKATGISAARVLQPFARQRFSTWFKRRPRVRIGKRQGSVALFPSCVVEYQQPALGHDIVKVYERNGIEVELADTGCCGAPWLHSGDIERFTKAAAKNVAQLASEVRRGRDIVVPEPTCGYVIKHDYPDYVPGPDSRLVAENAFDVSEYLMKIHRGSDTSLDVDFEGDVPASVTYHTPCHLRAQDVGLRSRDLMKLTGTSIKLVQQCAGIDGLWGLRATNADTSVAIGRRLGDAVEAAAGEVVAGDCQLANTVITEQTGAIPMHPIQVMARAYGIPVEDISH
ncbi:MAG TPA: heterodisulfide reductase-related iron-sulfur binding cluster [Ilumatobacteraceae bacterium]|jgi:Fe-S oxidoreductase